MPLTAELDGDRVQSSEYSPEHWLRLKNTYRSRDLQLSCGIPAIPKTSRLGLQFFAHKARHGCDLHPSSSESAEHQQMKLIVAEAATSAGWAATIEYPASDRSWIADVLLERDGRRVAVEVQLASQPVPEFKRRHVRYRNAGVECLWLVGPRNSSAAQNFPHFEVHPKLEAQMIKIGLHPVRDPEWHDLREGLTLLFGNKTAQWVEPTVTQATISTQIRRCERLQCNERLTVWYLSAVDVLGRCGNTARLNVSDYARDLAERVESIIQDVVHQNFKESNLPQPTFYDEIAPTGTLRMHLGQHCPHCLHPQSEYSMQGGRFWLQYDFEIPGDSLPINVDVLKRRHLCTDIGKGQCERPEPRPSAFPHRKQLSELRIKQVSGLPRPMPVRTEY